LPWTLLESPHAENLVEMMYIMPDEVQHLNLIEESGGVLENMFSKVLKMERSENVNFLDPGVRGQFSDNRVFGRRIYVPRQ